MNTPPIKMLNNVYLVGGAVRDMFLNKSSIDKDYVVVGSTFKQMIALGFKPIGKDFPVFLHPKTKEEYALARTERKTGPGYTGFAVDASESITLEEDLARRDLTINSMAMNVDGDIIDPYNGQHDLKNKILKHTTNAFSEDPLRVLRLARFRARYGYDWSIHKSTSDLVKQIKQSGELDFLVAERVWKETEKALLEDNPQLYFETLNELGVLQSLFPELFDMHDVPQPAMHHPEGDVFKHTMLVLKRSADLGYGLETRFAALTHDFGKAINFKELGHLRGHELRGVAVIESFCERLRIPNKLKNLAKLTSELHLKCHRIAELKPTTLQKMLIVQLNALKNPELFNQFIDACQCDAQGRGPTLVNKPYPSADQARFIVSKLEKLDAKKIVSDAQKKGKTGSELGDALRIAQIECIKQAKILFTET